MPGCFNWLFFAWLAGAAAAGLAGTLVYQVSHCHRVFKAKYSKDAWIKLTVLLGLCMKEVDVIQHFDLNIARYSIYRIFLAILPKHPNNFWAVHWILKSRVNESLAPSKRSQKERKRTKKARDLENKRETVQIVACLTWWATEYQSLLTCSHGSFTWHSSWLQPQTPEW